MTETLWPLSGELILEEGKEEHRSENSKKQYQYNDDGEVIVIEMKHKEKTQRSSLILETVPRN